jgi:hypothetical protein
MAIALDINPRAANGQQSQPAEFVAGPMTTESGQIRCWNDMAQKRSELL